MAAVGPCVVFVYLEEAARAPSEADVDTVGRLSLSV